MARLIDNKYENMFRWMSNKLRIQDRFNKNNQSKVKYPRGAIYACYFGENIGHEKSRLEARPCIVVSNNRINYNATNIVVIPLTKEIKYKKCCPTRNINISNQLRNSNNNCPYYRYQY